MRWAHPQPFRIKGWTVMEEAGGFFTAVRISHRADRVNVVCANGADALRRGVAQAEQVTTRQLVALQPPRGAHLRAVG
jgi:hypothetical protein